MVLRKPVAPRVTAPQEHQFPNALPYSVTPLSPSQPIILPARQGQPRASSPNLGPDPQAQQNSPAMRNGWTDGAIDRRKEDAELPATLRVGGMGPNAENPWGDEGLPASLRPGPAETPRSSFDSQRSSGSSQKKIDASGPDENVTQPLSSGVPHSNNPYLRPRNHDYTAPEMARSQEESGAEIWGELHANLPPSRGAPLPPPGQQSHSDLPVSQTAALSLSDQCPYSGLPSQQHWANSSPQPLRQAPAVPVELPTDNHRTSSAQSSLLSFTSEERQHALAGNGSEEPQTELSYAFDGSRPGYDRQAEAQQDEASPQELEGCYAAEELSSQAEPIVATDNHLPALPPNSEPVDASFAPPSPAAPVKAKEVPDPSTSDVEAQQNKAAKQRSETYQIKHVNWFDASSPTNPRISPILVQNANGPCPLLALVNALTLSTPADINTALVETLRVREQVSLGLLLDAVFDELTSGRRGDVVQELPDVGDLYTFLITLHTGMNVNPRFTSTQMKAPNLIDSSILSLPDTIQENRRPGGFEETREMRLYSTFAVPLIHGWLPPRNHPAYAALDRSAKTYEDAQNLMFREEELEDKLQRQGLSQEEQLMLEDIASIKFFLSSTATQLTGYGLDTINDALNPGSIAILFRNDHFSTLYRHPKSGQLLTLVTDMGYAGHAEVVWESLVDVNGEGCEYFSGDFRPVGNVSGDTQSQIDGTTSADDQGWTTVSRPKNTHKSRQPLPVNTPNDEEPPLSSTLDLATSPNTEQEDRDLALAMQLQEEEEDRSRRQALARQREDELSEAYLSLQEPSNRRSQPTRPGQFEPPSRSRGSGRIIGQDIRPLVPPRGGSVVRDPERGDDAPPPSYEQAAKGPAYHPPPDHPAHPNAPPASPTAGVPPATSPRPTMQGTRPRQMSAYSQNSAAYCRAPSTPGPGRRRSSLARSPTMPVRAPGYDGQPVVLRRRSGLDVVEDEARREKDCVVM